MGKIIYGKGVEPDKEKERTRPMFSGIVLAGFAGYITILAYFVWALWGTEFPESSIADNTVILSGAAVSIFTFFIILYFIISPESIKSN